MTYYLDPKASPVETFVAANAKNTIKCPFSGRFVGDGSASGLDLLESVLGPSRSPCPHSRSLELASGCGFRDDTLSLESKCSSEGAKRLLARNEVRERRKAREPASAPRLASFQCNAEWLEEDEERVEKQRGRASWQRESLYASPTASVTAAASRLRERPKRRVLLLSSEPRLRRDNSVGRRFLCVTYSEVAGDDQTLTFEKVVPCEKHFGGASPKSLGVKTKDKDFLGDDSGLGRASPSEFNLTSVGPCAMELGSSEASAAGLRLCLDVRLLGGVALLAAMALIGSRRCLH